MFTLVLGGASCGKSRLAEELVLQSGVQPRVYIATMLPYGEESKARILRHQSMRAQKGFSTLECYTHLAQIGLPEGCAALLECMGNLVANELFSPAGAKETAFEAITQGLLHLLKHTSELVVVTNDVHKDGQTYEAPTQHYRLLLAQLNAWMASRAQRVVEVVCGIPVVIKGEAL